MLFHMSCLDFAAQSFLHETNEDFPASDDYDERTSSLGFSDNDSASHFQLQAVKGKLVS